MEINLVVINEKYPHNIRSLKLNNKKVGKVEDFHIPRPTNKHTRTCKEHILVG